MRIFCISVIAIIGVSCSGTTDLSERIARLGSAGTEIDDVYALEDQREEAIPLLIARLVTTDDKVVSEDLSDSQDPKTAQVVWALRTLRFLSGRRFQAASATKIGRNDPRYLRLDTVEMFDFYTYWPTRGAYYFAPFDSQSAIIAHWQRWYDEGGPGEPYEPAEHYETWYD